MTTTRTARDILAEASTIAVVGASRHPVQGRAHGAAADPAARLARHPGEPGDRRALGRQQCYPTLADVPVPIDLVNVFRPSADAAEIARQAVAVGAKALWLQQGIVSPEARAIAEAAGIDYVEDQCIAVDTRRQQR